MDIHTDRDKIIIRTSVIGTLANVFLSMFKVIVGLTSHSIAIVMDAVNNLSDAASSVVTIVGMKIARKEADREHPFGHGRIEYLSALIISLLVLYAGVTAFVESVKKIIHPDTPDYSTASLFIVAVAVAVKIVLGRYVKHVGETVNSDALINSGEDASLDSLISASTLVAASIYLAFHISLEAWLGVVIALVILKSGFEMLGEAISRILGERADTQLARDIKETITGFPEISGAYDLVLHNYGPDSYNGSVHIEVPDTLSIDKLDRLIRKVKVAVLQKHNVLLTAVGVYSFNTKDEEAAAIRERIRQIVTANPRVLQMHAFNLDKEEKMIRFDIVVSFDAEDRRAIYQEVCENVQREYPDYTLQVVMDMDFSGESRDSG